MQSVYWRAGFVLLVIGQASCGGGGGDDGGSSRQASVSANIASITLSKTVAETTTPVVIRVSVANVTGDVYAGLEFSGDAIAVADWAGQSDETAGNHRVIPGARRSPSGRPDGIDSL